jgi:enoyl-CoA hydratase/carnithine racemase
VPPIEIDPGAGFRVDLHGELVTVTLSRPELLNCQTPQTWAGLAQLRRELPGTVRVLVIRGAGRAFSSGLDRSLFTAEDGLRALPALPPQEATARIAAWQQGFDWSSRPGLVSIAAVHGYAIGAGFQLALGCDLRILADDAQLAMGEAPLGLVPDLGGTKRLVELIGYSRAAELCLTGRRVGAEEALRIGLASRVVANGELDAAVEETVQALLAVPRDAAAETKALLLRATGRSQAEQEAAERDAQYRRLRALAGLEAED